MELEGSLKAFSLPEVLQFLSMGKMSGRLHLKHDNHANVLTIRSGRIVNSASQRRPRLLGEMLVQRGVIKRRELEEVVSLQKTIETDKRLGEILLERELVSEADLHQAVRHQLEEEIWDLFSWEDGHFNFEHGREEDIQDVAVEIDIEPLLLEGSRRQDEWARIRRSIPEDTVVFGIVPLSPDFERTLELKQSEWQVLSSINGHLSVEAVVNRCSLGRFETCHILEDFLERNLIRPVDPLHSTNGMRNGSVVTTSPEAMSRATALGGNLPAESAGRRIGGFFGVRSKAAAREEETQKIQMVAPVSQICTLLTAFTHQAVNHRDFNARPEEHSLLQTVWRDVLMKHPRADLIRVGGNVADPTELEAFIEMTEYSAVVHECHEEAMDALIKSLRIVYRITAQRLGEKTVQRMLAALLDAAASRMVLKYGGSFDLAALCTKSLGIAA